MINLLLGASGGGKSYEAVRYHILPALEAGRKVITNLPLNLEAFSQINPEYARLIERRVKPMPVRGQWLIHDDQPAYDLYLNGHTDEAPVGQRAFAGVWDYYTTDADKNDKGQGALFVIDECQLCLPYKATHQHVEEWFSLHRHYNVDVLLITQSYGKISQAVRDNVQIVYRVRKNIALGSTKSYTRKVQDGLRGEVVNTSVRQYEPNIFKLYKSHTQGQSVEEFNASDIVPLWKRWPFIGLAVCVAISVYLFGVKGVSNPMAVKVPSKNTVQNVTSTPRSITGQNVTPLGGGGGHPLAGGSAPEPREDDLLTGRGLHIAMHIKSASKEVWKFYVSQNGQGSFLLDLSDLKTAGYIWKPYGECMGFLYGHGSRRVVACDAPTSQATVGGIVPDQSAGDGGAAPHVDLTGSPPPHLIARPM